MDGTAAADDFGRCWATVSDVPGWLTTAQARALWDAATVSDPHAPIVEIGSHQGRSTLVLASARPAAQPPVVAIDPFLDHAMLGGAGTRTKFEANVRAAQREPDIRLIVAPSGQVRPTWRRPISLLYIDGKHDYWTVRDDLRWADHVIAGAPLFIHDCFSSVGVTLAVVVAVLPRSRLRYVGREGSLARFELSKPSIRDRVRLAAQLPWFARNLVIKIALRIGRLLGYRGTPDPY